MRRSLYFRICDVIRNLLALLLCGMLIVPALSAAAYVKESSSQLVRVSIGIALAPHHGVNFETLYRCADEALYQAKKTSDTYIVLYGCREEVCGK